MLYQLSYFRNKKTFKSLQRYELLNSRDITAALVPRTGLEPACLSTHAPETCASTNSATWAKDLFQYIKDVGAENETRTRDPNLGKVMLYQLSYFRIHLNLL